MKTTVVIYQTTISLSCSPRYAGFVKRGGCGLLFLASASALGALVSVAAIGDRERDNAFIMQAL